MREAPSKYHTRGYVGEKNGEYGTPYRWSWDSSHPDLVPTATFKCGYDHYCAYCCGKAYPIQAGLRSQGFMHRFIEEDYETTGYCCICEAAEQEKVFNGEMEELQKKHKEEVWALRERCKDALAFDVRKRIEMEYTNRLKELEWDLKTGRIKEGYTCLG